MSNNDSTGAPRKVPTKPRPLPEMSPAMQAALDAALKNGGKLVRQPTGMWMGLKGDVHAAGSVYGLVVLGKMRYSKRVSGDTGYAVEAEVAS